jgi:branched-chain amino acid transport system ATP-binding protein
MNEVILSVKDVVKRFGGLVALNRVSFDMIKGEILGLIGPNGSGKTTLFNVMTGYYKPDEGKVFFENEEITNKPPYEIANKGIGRTFQIVKPFLRLTVLENVVASALLKYTKEDAISQSIEILKLVKLYDKRFVESSSLNLVEKRKLELARALALKPKLLLLDEVLAGLNPTEIDEMLILLRKINKMGISILMVEHVMRAVMNISDRIIVLHNGIKIAEGSPIEVANTKKVIDVYLGEEII